MDLQSELLVKTKWKICLSNRFLVAKIHFARIAKAGFTGIGFAACSIPTVFHMLLQPKFRKERSNEMLAEVDCSARRARHAWCFVATEILLATRKQIVSGHWGNLKQVAKVSESVPMFLGPPSW